MRDVERLRDAVASRLDEPVARLVYPQPWAPNVVYVYT